MISEQKGRPLLVLKLNEVELLPALEEPYRILSIPNASCSCCLNVSASLVVFTLSGATFVFVSAFADTLIQPFVHNGARVAVDCSGITKLLIALAPGGVPQKLHWQ